MASKKLIAIVAVVVIAVAAIALAGSSSNKEADGECTYSCQEVSSYNNGFMNKLPGTGYKYIKVTGTLKNNTDKYGLSNNPYNFKLNADNVEYTYEWSFEDTATATQGGSLPFGFIYKVPSTVSVTSLVWKGIGTDVDMIKK